MVMLNTCPRDKTIKGAHLWIIIVKPWMEPSLNDNRIDQFVQVCTKKQCRLNPIQTLNCVF